MKDLEFLLDELVTANRILAHEGIVDAYGHISLRHPDLPDRYFLSRARTPQCVERSDLMEFTLDGEPIEARGRAPSFRALHPWRHLLRASRGEIRRAQPQPRRRALQRRRWRRSAR